MPAPAAHIAFLTIGQSPRPDLSGPVEEFLSPGTVVEHVGVLDGLDADEIGERFGAREGGPVLVSRLADGTTVRLDAHAVESGLTDCVSRLDSAGVTAIVVLCTGEFPALSAERACVLEPDAVVTASVAALTEESIVGVIVPMSEQIAEAEAKWSGLAREPVFAHATPYAEEPTDLVAAARDLIARGARTIVLDCMGYQRRHKEELLSAGVTVPVLVSGVVFGQAVAPLLGG